MARKASNFAGWLTILAILLFVGWLVGDPSLSTMSLARSFDGLGEIFSGRWLPDG